MPTCTMLAFARPALLVMLCVCGVTGASAQGSGESQAAWQAPLATAPLPPVSVTLNARAFGAANVPANFWQPRGGVADGSLTTQATQASLGLEFRRASPHQSAKDLMKVQLTADSVLNFRPRGGGMVVTYRSKF